MESSIPDVIVLDAEADMQGLEAELLADTRLNFSRDEAAALCTTLSVLQRNSIPALRFASHYLTVLPSPPPSSAADALPSKQTLDFLSELVVASRDAASGLITSSLVAGRRSEAEDHGDVAFWVGECDEASVPECILEKLNITSTEEIWSIENHGDQLLTSLNMINPLELNAASRTLSPTLALLSKLDKLSEFRTRLTEDGSLALYLCVGELEGQWVGLLGVSVES